MAVPDAEVHVDPGRVACRGKISRALVAPVDIYAESDRLTRLLREEGDLEVVVDVDDGLVGSD